MEMREQVAPRKPAARSHADGERQWRGTPSAIVVVLLYSSADELRSMSDKALGARSPSRITNICATYCVCRKIRNARNVKIQFLWPFTSICANVFVRILLPVPTIRLKLIEQMEIELSRLDGRADIEQKLAISSRSVANIIRKTIQREQNCIRMLNQGLQSVSVWP